MVQILVGEKIHISFLSCDLIIAGYLRIPVGTYYSDHIQQNRQIAESTLDHVNNGKGLTHRL